MTLDLSNASGNAGRLDLSRTCRTTAGSDRGGLDGQGEADAGAAPRLAHEAELAAVGHHQVLDDGQAEPGAAQLPRTGSVDAIEAFGDARQIGGGEGEGAGGGPRVASGGRPA